MPNLIEFIVFSASPRDDNEFPIKLQCKLWQWLMAILNFWSTPKLLLGRRGRDPIVVGYITTYVISAYYHLRCELESQSGEVYSIQHYVMKFII